MKNILFLINKIEIGGAEGVFAKQASYLNTHGFNVYFGTIKASSSQLDNIKISKGNIVSFNFKNLADIKAYLRLYKFIKSNHVSIVYATLDHANIVARIIKSIIPSLYIIIRESGMADRKTLKLKIADVILNFFCNRIMAVSAEVKKSLLAYQKIHAKKIEVLENGAEIVKSQEEIRANAFQKDENVIRLLNVGSMNNDNKGQDGLINMLWELKKDEPALNLKLVLVGDGKLRSNLKGMVNKHGLSNQALFSGIINYSELRKNYLSSDIFVLNSKSEGCSNVVLEAMSFGLPVISTKVGGAAEIIKDEESGFLVDFKDSKRFKEKIIKLTKDKDLRINMGINAYERVKNSYSFSKQAEKLISMLSLN